MRKDVFLAVAMAALALAGCKATDGTMGLDSCGLGCNIDTTDDDPPVDPVDSDGDGEPDPTEFSGNNNTLATGDTTLAFEGGALVSPGEGSLSRTTVTGAGAKFEINTKAKTGDEGWIAAHEIEEYAFGSNAPDFFSPANGFDPAIPQKLGAQRYKEYRVAGPKDAGQDEVLQVWEFSDDTYATQYRRIAGGESPNRAFSFGGNKTAAIPSTGSATYRGSFGSIAKGDNWVNPEAADPDVTKVVDRNQNFQVDGSAVLTADFGAGTMTGTLTPERWRWFDEEEKRTLHYSNADDEIYNGTSGATAWRSGDDADEPFFFRSGIGIDADITGNTYKGRAKFGDPWVSGANPVHGAFFGAGAKETTGAFAATGTTVAPIGGEFPADDDRAGYIEHSGVFHGACQPGGACTP